MVRSTRTFTRLLAMLLVFSVGLLSAPFAEAKPLTPEKVRERILKQDLGSWIGVELQNGTVFGGRLVRVEPDSFGLQLHNDPGITPVLFSDVVCLHTGVSRGAFEAIAIAGVSGVVVAAIVGFGLVHRHSQMPTLPNQPTQPVFP